MENIENIEIDIQNLKDAYDNIVSAINNLNEIDGLDEEYKQLDSIAKLVNDKRLELELELERLEEDAYYKENELQWEAEQQEQEREYWNSQF